MQIDIEINPAVEDTKVLITAKEKNQFINDLVDVLSNYSKKKINSLTAYINDKVYFIDVAEILRIYTANQKVYIQTSEAEYLIKYRLYELEDLLDSKRFLRISNSEIVNIKKISNIDLNIIGKICIHLSGNIQTYASRRYIPKIKKSLEI